MSNIQRLTDLEVVRKNPGLYGDSDGIEGTQQTFKEIINNTVDLYLKDNAYNHIDVEFSDKDNWFRIRDYGNGLPIDWNENEQEYDYNLVMFTLNAGSNYNNNEDEVTTIGKFGIGMSFSIMSSEYAEVVVIKDKDIHTFKVENGVLVSNETTNNTDNIPTGTSVLIKPSDEVFTDTNLSEDWIKQYLKEQTVTNKGFKIDYTNTDTEDKQTYYYEEGIKDYIKELSDEERFTDMYGFESDMFRGRDTSNRPEYNSQYNVQFTFTQGNSGIVVFHNSSKLTDESSQHKAVSSAFSYAFDRIIKEENKYNKNESKINFDDIEESLLIIVNTYSTYTSYKAQTKKGVSNKFIKDTLNEILREFIQTTYIENKKDINKAIDQSLVNKRANDKAEKTKVDVRKKLKTNIDTIKNVVGDYIPPRTESGSNYLAICEGKSALAAMRSGRDSNVYGIYPLRGKILNTFKSSKDKILANDVIMDLYSIMGTGMDLGGRKGSKQNNFDIDKLKFDKVVIFTDADVDGVGSILPLLISMFYNLSPELIRQGKIYFGQTPKYEIKTLNKEYYAFDDERLQEIKEELGNEKHTVHYIKGLAELSAEGMKLCLQESGENLIQLTLDDIESEKLLEVYMGKDVEPRKKLILESFESGDVIG